jgi:hypothetical protein
MAFHEVLMDHHRNVESEGMAAVYVCYAGSIYRRNRAEIHRATDQIAVGMPSMRPEVRGKSSHTAYGKALPWDGIDVGHR